METSPYVIPETTLRSWDPHSKRKAYFEGQEEALRQAQSKTPKKAIHTLIEEAIKATSARVQVEERAARAEKATDKSGLDILGFGDAELEGTYTRGGIDALDQILECLPPEAIEEEARPLRRIERVRDEWIRSNHRALEPIIGAFSATGR
jgi:hypothetical protein